LGALEFAMSDFPGWSRGLQAALDRLSIAAPRAAHSQRAGPVLSRSLGRALEFADYRAYSPGDDPKLVDWRAYNRLDRLYLKQYREERARTIALLVDGSASLDWGEAEQHKGAYARKLAAALAWIAAAHLEALQVFVLRGERATALRTPTGRAGIASLFRGLATEHERDRLALGDAISHALEQLRGDGPLFLITDLLDDDWQAALRLLSARQQHDVVLQVLAPDEWEPPLGDEVELQDSETDELRQTRFGPGEVRDYHARLAAFIEGIHQTSARLGLRHVAIDTATPLQDTLLKTLTRAGILQ
jgi:uncharacterized protein (DUF58 family)